MEKHDQDDALATPPGPLIDHGAEIFIKKMFRHSQSRVWRREPVAFRTEDGKDQRIQGHIGIRPAET